MGILRIFASFDSNHIQTAVKNKDNEQDESLDKDTKDNGGSFKPRPQLSQPFTCMRDLASLMQGLEDGTINVEPEYQREVVWTAERMTGLIDSLMENFYIPPIILNKKIHRSQASGKGYTLVCIDGKQRLSSVRAFIKGMIPCHDHCGEKWYFSDTPSSRRKHVLPEALQKQFLQKEFVSFEYSDLSHEREEDLFARVQMGVQLSLAEKIRASTGPWQELAKLYVEDFPVIYSLMKDRSRAKDFQLTLSCFSQIVEVQHPKAASGIPSLVTNHNYLPKLLENAGAVDDDIKSHLASVWNTFNDLVNEHPDTFTNVERKLKGVQTFAPIEMVAVAVLISMHSEARNNKVLLGDIWALRNALRENFIDLRMNISLWKFIWDFIDKLEAIRGDVDGPDKDRRTIFSRPTLITKALPTSPMPVVRRGRPTARTKPPFVRSGEDPNSVVSKIEKRQDTLPAEPRQTKRQRSGPGFNDVHSPGPPMHSSSGPNVSPSPPVGTRPTEYKSLSGAIRRHGQAINTNQTEEILVPASSSPPNLPYTAQTTRKSRECLSRTDQQIPPSRIITTTQSMSPAYTPGYRPPPTPGHIRQTLAPGFNGYRGPVGQIGVLVHTPIVRPYAPTAPVSSFSSRVQSPLSATNVVAQHQLEAITDSVFSTYRSVPPQSYNQPQPQSMRKPSPRTAPQFDSSSDAIDLTGDTEQERQDILSSLKSKATGGHSAHEQPQPHASVPPLPIQRRSTAHVEAEEQDLLPSKNPYARPEHK